MTLFPSGTEIETINKLLGSVKAVVDIITKILTSWRNRKPDSGRGSSIATGPSDQANQLKLEVAPTSQATPMLSYAKCIGQRHKGIRENLLGLDLRTMATFYGLSEVKDLEAFEAGKREFPQRLTEQLCETFHIQKQYMYEGVGEELSTTHFGGYEACLTNGFEPYLYCEPASDRNLYMQVYTCFAKRIQIGHRTLLLYVKSMNVGSFDSSHGGKNSICQLILAMKNSGFAQRDRVRIRSASDLVTVQIREGVFYPRGDSMPGCGNTKYEDVFDDWFKEVRGYPERAG